MVWILLSCGGDLPGQAALLEHPFARQAAEDVARREADAEARQVIARIESGVRRIEDSTRQLASSIETLDPSDAELEALLGQYVAGRRRVFGAAAASEPGGWRAGIDRYAPYVCRDVASPDTLARKNLPAAARGARPAALWTRRAAIWCSPAAVHDAPVHVTAAGTAALTVAGGPLLGLLEEAEFPVNALGLAPGESTSSATTGWSGCWEVLPRTG